MDKLTLGDAAALRDNFSYSAILSQCYSSRADPVAYLSSTFKHPLTLLSTMFDTGCVISGSRALDFFVPGSARPESDWDFYVPGYKESVADMVNALGICGVSWQLEGDKIISTLRTTRTAIVSRTVLECIHSWISSVEPKAVERMLGNELHAVMQAYRELKLQGGTSSSRFKVTMAHDDKINILPGRPPRTPESHEADYTDISGRAFSILQGQVCTGKGDQKVQLIIGSYYSGIRSCMSFIKDFYASHVQCFIGGWCAGHMYYRGASEKKATYWKPWPHRRTATHHQAVSKYNNRGFEFTRAKDMGPTTRRLQDDESLFLDFGDMYRPFVRKSHHGLLDAWLTARRENIDGITWTEFDGRIFSMQDTVEACFRRCETTFASHAVDLPLNRLRRLANLISLNAEGSDSLRSDAFRSSIASSLESRKWQLPELVRSGTVFCGLRNATPWSWAL